MATMTPPKAWQNNPQQAGPTAGQVWDQAWWDQSGINTQGNPYAYAQGGQAGPWNPAQVGQWFAQMGQGQLGWRGNTGPAPGTPGTGGTGAPGQANVQTSIQPRDIYTSQMTQQRVNQATADALQGGTLDHILKQFDRAGVSRSGRNTALAMPQVAGAYGAAQQAQAAIPLADTAANQQNRLRGEIAQGLEFNQLARLLLGEQGLDFWKREADLNSIGRILGPLMGGIGGLI